MYRKKLIQFLRPSKVKIKSLVRLSPDRMGPLGKPPASLALLPSRASSLMLSNPALLAPQCRYEAIQVWSYTTLIMNETVVMALGFFYREPSATGGHYWFPALLGWNLANAGNTKTVENRNWAMLLHDVYFIRSRDPQIHNNQGCKTTINWFRRTCNESKITLYYWLYTIFTMQFTDLLIVHFFYFLLLFFKACLFHWLWKPAKWMCQNDPPNKCAKMTRQNILPWQPAGFTREKTRRIYSPEKICHFNSRLACQRSPLPCSKSPG